MFIYDFKVDSPNVRYEGDAILSRFEYDDTVLEETSDNSWTVRPTRHIFDFRTNTKLPKLG